MLKRICWFTLFVFVNSAVWCQDTTGKKLALLLSPVLTPVPTVELGLQPGIEVYLRHWSLTAQVAFPLHKPHLIFTNVHYLRESLELKRFFNPEQAVHKYLAAEVLYAHRNFTDTNGGVYFKSKYKVGNRYSYSQAHINSPIFTGVIKAGVQLPLSKRLLGDAFVGLGVRTTYTTYSDVQSEESRPYGYLALSFPKSAYRFDKTISNPHISTGFKLGYLLK